MRIEDQLLINRAALKGLLIELESSLGVAGAISVTMPILISICGLDRAILAARRLLC